MVALVWKSVNHGIGTRWFVLVGSIYGLVSRQLMGCWLLVSSVLGVGERGDSPADEAVKTLVRPADPLFWTSAQAPMGPAARRMPECPRWWAVGCSFVRRRVVGVLPSRHCYHLRGRLRDDDVARACSQTDRDGTR